MKNSIYKKVLQPVSVFILAFILFNACHHADVPVAPELKVSQEEFYIGKDGGTITFTVTSNKDWAIRASGNVVLGGEAWCTITPMTGKAGTQTVTVEVDTEEDENADARVASLLIAASATGKHVKIIQSGKPFVLTSEAKDIYESSATLTGVWGYADKIEMLEIGIAYRASSGTEFIYQPADGVAQGPIEVELSGLTHDTEYVFKAYVKEAGDIYYYGEEKEFTTAPMPTVERISSIRALGTELNRNGTKTIENNGILKGIIVSDHSAGNINPLWLAFVDGTIEESGIFIALPAGTEHDYQLGDSLSIRSKGSVLKRLNQNTAYELAVNPKQITKISSGHQVEVLLVSHTDLEKYEAMYVEVQNTQITRNFTDQVEYPVWNDGAMFNFDMEVAGSEDSYVLNVLGDADFASEPIIRESGTLRGIVVNSAASSTDRWAAVYPRTSADLSGLTEERFASLLSLRFGVPTYDGRLFTFSAVANARIRIQYYHGDGTIFERTITATVSGEAAEGITVSSVTNHRLSKGSGYIDLVIGGTPEVAGDVVFTISGLDDYLAEEDRVCGAVVAEAEVPEGNFEVFWDTRGLSGYGEGRDLASASNNASSAVAVSAIVARNFETGGTGRWNNAWGGVDWSGNTESNKLYPEKDAQFAVTVLPGKILSLISLNMNPRFNGVPSISVQYKVNNDQFVELSLLSSSPSPEELNPYKTDLKEVANLQNLAGGTIVTFRLVPIGGTATGRWALNVNNNTGKSLSLAGDVIE